MLKQNSIVLQNSEIRELFSPTSPDFLRSLHPAWDSDITRLFPWKKRGDHWLSGTPAESSGLVVTGPCSSTMEVARHFRQSGILEEWQGILAPSQIAGRGQLRRNWYSPPGNIYVSTIWPSLEKPWNGLAPLLAGYCLCEALSQFVPSVEIKWPNDLLLNNRKVGGILIEERGETLVVGTGLNLSVAPPESELRESHAVTATSLAEYGLGFGPISLWDKLAGKAWKTCREILSRTAPENFLRRVENRLAWLGQEVRVNDGSTLLTGHFLGLAPDGGLRIGRGVEEVTLYSGSLYLV